MAGPSVVVVGGSVAGMFSALALARAGCTVTVLERDEQRLPDGVDEAFGWARGGTPQLQQIHFFLTRLRVELAEHFPDVLEALYEAGGTNELIIGPGLAGIGPEADTDGPDDLRLLAMRRTSFDWALRRVMLAEPAVSVATGSAVVGVTAQDTDDGVVAVNGVELTDGATIDADEVVVATGKRADVAGWLAPYGVMPTEHVGADPRVMYFSRHYRLNDGQSFPDTGRAPGRGRAGVGCGVSPADNDTFSVAVSIRTTDTELRPLLSNPDSYEAVCRLYPETEPWFREGLAEPISDVKPMAGLQNRTRSLLDDAGDPMVVGVHLIGDAHTVSNPLYGRGCTLAAIQAVALADAISNHPGDSDGVARAYAAANTAEVEPWYRLAVEMDSVRHGGDDPESVEARWPLNDVIAASSIDPAVGAAFVRMWVMVDDPAMMFEDPGLTERAARAVQERRNRRPSTRRSSAELRQQVLHAATHPNHT